MDVDGISAILQAGSIPATLIAASVLLRSVGRTFVHIADGIATLRASRRSSGDEEQSHSALRAEPFLAPGPLEATDANMWKTQSN